MVEVVKAYDREFIKGNIPEIDKLRCLGCGHCVDFCRSLGPNVLDMKEGKAIVARPHNCISDGACMIACPTKAILWMTKQEF